MNEATSPAPRDGLAGSDEAIEPIEATGVCPKWSDGRHNEMVIKGLFGRRYSVCVSCGAKRKTSR